MRYAILSDVHANAEAYQRVLADAEENGAEKIVCLGDIIGYGPMPSEALIFVQTTADIVLTGNHDAAVSGRIKAEDFIDLAGDAIVRHRELLTRENLLYLRSLPYTAEIEGALCSHGDFVSPPDFNYVETNEDARSNFDATDTQLLFVGHTHVPAIHLTGPSGAVYRLDAQDFVAETGKRYLVNVGSVGYPRESDGVCLSTYVLYDSETKTVRFRRLPFSVASMLQRGKERPRRRALLIGAIAGAFAFVAVAIATAFAFREGLGGLKGLGGTRSVASAGSEGLGGRAARPAPPSKHFANGGTRQDERRELLSDDDNCAAPPFAERTLELSASVRHVRANLKLDQKGGSALLSVTFENTEGAAIATVNAPRPVKRSNKTDFDVPPGAVRAVFKVRPAAPGKDPQIKSFAPSAD